MCPHALQITALKNLNLNIRRAKLSQSGNTNTFFITEADTRSVQHSKVSIPARVTSMPGGRSSAVTPSVLALLPCSEKIVKSARLEEIRMTVLNTLIATFPVSRGLHTPLHPFRTLDDALLRLCTKLPVMDT